MLTFLDVKDARGKALEILLGFTGTQENRLLFKETDAVKQLLRVILEEAETEAQEKETIQALQCLINLCQDKCFIEQCCELGAARKIFELLKVIVKPDIKDKAGDIKLD